MPWYFGLMREAGGYRIVASGPSRARVDRELAHIQVATMIVTQEDLPPLGIGASEISRWLPLNTPSSSTAPSDPSSAAPQT